jgi:hypothetical protein
VSKQFGFYGTLLKLAESGLFNRNGLTPLESAEAAPVRAALAYLNYTTAMSKAESLAIEATTQKK